MEDLEEDGGLGGLYRILKSMETTPFRQTIPHVFAAGTRRCAHTPAISGFSITRIPGV